MVIVELHCGHVVRINDVPRLDEPCPQCPSTLRGLSPLSVVRDYWREAWHVDCDECGWHTRHGLSQRYALDAVGRHNAQTRCNTRVSARFYADPPPRVAALLRETERSEKFSRNLSETVDPPY